MDKELVVKYLNYLVDFTEQLIEKYNTNKTDVEALQKEFLLFKSRTLEAENTDISFKIKIQDIKFTFRGNQQRGMFRKITRRAISLFGLGGAIISEEIERTDRIEILREFRNKISHLLFEINSFEF